jgi:hypothetical protein
MGYGDPSFAAQKEKISATFQPRERAARAPFSAVRHFFKLHQ